MMDKAILIDTRSRDRRRSSLRFRVGLAAVNLLLIGLIVWESVRSADGPADGELPAWTSELVQEPGPGTARLLGVIGSRRLFEPAVPLPGRPVARESVERIRSRLLLHAIMDVAGVPAAYIHVKGDRMRAFHVGQGVDDLFTVTRIEPGLVEVEIVGERIRLEL